MVYFMAKSYWTEKEREEAESDVNTRSSRGSRVPSGYSKGKKVTESGSWQRD